MKWQWAFLNSAVQCTQETHCRFCGLLVCLCPLGSLVLWVWRSDKDVTNKDLCMRQLLYLHRQSLHWCNPMSCHWYPKSLCSGRLKTKEMSLVKSVTVCGRSRQFITLAMTVMVHQHGVPLKTNANVFFVTMFHSSKCYFSLRMETKQFDSACRWTCSSFSYKTINRRIMGTSPGRMRIMRWC